MSDEIVPILYRLEGKFDSLSDEVKRHFQDDKDSFSDIQDRLGKVEKKTWAAGGIISLVVAYFTTKLTGGH